MQMKEEWPGLGFSTYHLLQKVQDKYGRMLAAEIADRILWEIKNAKQS
jgi:hypothetical protein